MYSSCCIINNSVAVGFYLSDGVGSCASATPQATEVCCPGDTTADPAPTDPPAGTDPVCEFCPLGIEITGDVLLPMNIAGIGGSTCEELSAGYEHNEPTYHCIDHWHQDSSTNEHASSLSSELHSSLTTQNVWHLSNHWKDCAAQRQPPTTGVIGALATMESKIQMFSSPKPISLAKPLALCTSIDEMKSPLSMPVLFSCNHFDSFM